MNKFSLEGTVKEVEACTSKKGTPYWSLMLLCDDGQDVPVTVFDAVAIGDHIRVSGRLSYWQSQAGFKNLQFSDIKMAKTGAQGPPAADEPDESDAF